MPKLPRRFPENTKYVVEACGPLVRRYVELPGGRIRTSQTAPRLIAEFLPSTFRMPDSLSSTHVQELIRR